MVEFIKEGGKTTEEIEFDLRTVYPGMNDRDINLVCLGYTHGYHDGIVYAQKQANEVMGSLSTLSDRVNELMKD